MEVGKDYIGVGCGAIIVNDKNEVLLVQRSKDARTEPGTWSRPGGQVEFGETVEQAVEREVLEETGLAVKALSVLEVRSVLSEGKHWLAIGYLAKYISGEPRNTEPTKHDAVKWFPLDDLPEPLNEYTRSSINIYLNGSRVQ